MLMAKKENTATIAKSLQCARCHPTFPLSSLLSLWFCQLCECPYMVALGLPAAELDRICTTLCVLFWCCCFT